MSPRATTTRSSVVDDAWQDARTKKMTETTARGMAARRKATLCEQYCMALRSGSPLSSVSSTVWYCGESDAL